MKFRRIKTRLKFYCGWGRDAGYDRTQQIIDAAVCWLFDNAAHPDESLALASLYFVDELIDVFWGVDDEVSTHKD